MPPRRRHGAREAQLAFDALSIEGGLLSPEWLSRVAQLQAGTQAEADYRIPKGLNLRDEIGRYWRIAQAHWAELKSSRDAKADPKAGAERFILAILRDAFGFTSLVAVPPAVLSERTYPIGCASLGGRVPVVIAPVASGLDTLSPSFGDGTRRRSAFGLAQEYLNAQEGALWGIASDGVTLRTVRDNASLTRPAWIEADLQRILTEERYADFAALWLLCHETRFGREGQPVTECALEAWRSAGREEGTRAREHLRRGVEDALVALGQGFLSHAENAVLRADLQNGTLPVKDYFNQLLRLVYRLIFLLTVEERGLLHPDGTSDAAKALYANGYGLRRLRERSAKRSAHDRFSDLWEATKVVCRGLAHESHSIRQTGRYPLCGKGDVNTYAIFAEHNRSSLGPRGRAGYIVPPGLATDDTTKAYFQDVVAKNALVALYEFENEEFLFPGIDHRVRFIVITVAKERPATSPGADISFANRSVTALSDQAKHFTLAPADFETLNPNTRTCPTFRSRRDADINLAMYRRAGVLWREANEESRNPWHLRFLAMFHMSNDSGLFRSRADLEAAKAHLEGNRFVGPAGEFLPLVEAKMVRHFDHRFGTYEGQTEAQDNQGKLPEFDDAAHFDAERFTHPYYWVAEAEVAERLSGRWDRSWLIGWRDICRSTDQRTVLSSLIPRSAVGDKFLLMLPGVEPRLAACLYASLCSFPLDYAARQKVGGTSLKYFTMRQLPVLRPGTYEADTPWDRGTTLRDWILSRVVELTYTASDLRSFARDVGFDVPPFEWRPQRRFDLRCELDAAFFRLYALSKDDVAHVMETFPIVRRNEEKANDGVYRTKETILSIYDDLVAAERTGTAYRTRLAPPPADKSITHRVPGGGKVLPFRPAVRPQPAVQPAVVTPAPRHDIPAWSPELLPAVATKTGLAASAGRWGTTLTGVDLGIAALAAVLRNVGGSPSRDEVERAVVLSVLPDLLLSKFDAQAAPKWRRAIGTANMNLTSIAALSIPWAEVLRRATVEHLLEIDADGQWRAGADIADAPSAELDARALVALSWLESVRGAAIEDAELVTQLGVLRAA